MSSFRLTLLVLLMVALWGCCPGYQRISFMYTSNTHLRPDEVFVTVSAPPKAVAFTLSRALRGSGARIMEREPIKKVPIVPPDADKCWEATHELHQGYLRAYEVNDICVAEDTEDADPHGKLGVDNDCFWIKMEERNNLDGYFLKAELDQRTASRSFRELKSVSVAFSEQGVPAAVGYDTADGTDTLGFTSRISFWIWRSADGKTRVYAKAVPFNNVEAARGHDIGYQWWREVTGEREATLVKNYLTLLEELDAEGKITVEGESSDTGRAAAGCTSNADCKGGRVCIDGRCEAAAGCTKDTDCKGDRVCVKGECVPPP